MFEHGTPDRLLSFFLIKTLTVDPLFFCFSFNYIIWYLDDATLGGPVDKIIHDLKSIIPALAMIGLEINASKSEVVNLDMDAVDFQNALEKIRGILKEVQVILFEKLIMLGAPIFSCAIKASLSAKHSQLLKMIDRLSYLNAHQAFFFFKIVLQYPNFF